MNSHSIHIKIQLILFIIYLSSTGCNYLPMKIDKTDSPLYWEILEYRPLVTHSSSFSDIYFADSKNGWAIADGLTKTMNGGKTWIPFKTKGIAIALYFTNPTIGWVTGLDNSHTNYGYKTVIQHTTDGGKSWQEQETDIPEEITNVPETRLKSIKFYDDNIGWAAGDKIIIHTINGGSKWTTQFRSQQNLELLSITCRNTQEAWAVGENGIILHTEDGGNNWHYQESSTKASLTKVKYFNNTVWIIGENGTLIRTINNHLDMQSLGVHSTLSDIFINGSEGWIVGSDGILLHSIDGGLTWKQQKAPVDSDINSIFFSSPDLVWAGGEYSLFMCYSKHTVK